MDKPTKWKQVSKPINSGHGLEWLAIQPEPLQVYGISDTNLRDVKTGDIVLGVVIDCREEVVVCSITDYRQQSIEMIRACMAEEMPCAIHATACKTKTGGRTYYSLDVYEPEK